MGLVHTPRVLASIAKGFIKQRTDPAGCWSAGIGFNNAPYQYHARVGLFDVDYMGHLNNAAYLSHAELARWEMTAYHSGFLTTMWQHRVNMLVAGTAIRYRREIRPFGRLFQIDTCCLGIDNKRNLWIVHNFRYPAEHKLHDANAANSGHIKNESPVRAQMIVRGVAVQGTRVLDLLKFFRNEMGVDEDIMEQLIMPKTTAPSTCRRMEEEVLEKYISLEGSFRKAAAVDFEPRQPAPVPVPSTQTADF